MKKLSKVILSLVLVLSLVVSIAAISLVNATSDSKDTMLIGVGKADITGPVTGISTGYNSLGDLLDGLLTRLNARAFIVDDNNGKRIAYVSAELVHMTESIKPSVLKELKARGITDITEDNLMLSATHCHSSSSNTSWYGLYDLINGIPGYDEESFEYIVNGIADAIETAHNNMVPGHLVLSYGDTNIESFNRSLYAAKWNNNYEEKYGTLSDIEAASATVDKEMQVIRFVSADKDIGLLSFFPSHGTSNSIDNTLVAADHKGYACYFVEQAKGDGFVAANCQAESGDVSPNMPQSSNVKAKFLRPIDRGVVKDAIENQVFAGQQEANAMLALMNGKGTTIELDNILAYNYTTADFSDIAVSKEYIGNNYMPYDDIENAHTSEPCIGAGIIAGDEEGAPVDNAAEGSVRHNFILNDDGTVTREQYDFSTISLSGLEKLFKPVWPYAMKLLRSDSYDEAQAEKVVCLAVGDLMQKTQPVQIFRIGELAIAGVSFEVSTEQGERIRTVLENTLSQIGVTKVILSTHSNAYSQYMCTREEYAAQHYEGATDLFGPWSGAAMTQTLDGLAKDMVAGVQSDKGPGLRNSKPLVLLPTATSILPSFKDASGYGTVVTDVDTGKIYNNGDKVTATFKGTNPRHIVDLVNAGKLDRDAYSYMEVQKREGTDWVTVKTDADPYTTFQYTDNQATVSWLLRDVDAGTYRLVYNAYAKTGTDKYEPFTAYSSSFTVIKGTVPTDPTEPTTDPTTPVEPTTDPVVTPTDPTEPADEGSFDIGKLITPVTTVLGELLEKFLPDVGDLWPDNPAADSVVDKIVDTIVSLDADNFLDTIKGLFGGKSTAAALSAANDTEVAGATATNNGAANDNEATASGSASASVSTGSEYTAQEAEFEILVDAAATDATVSGASSQIVGDSSPLSSVDNEVVANTGDAGLTAVISITALASAAFALSKKRK